MKNLQPHTCTCENLPWHPSPLSLKVNAKASALEEIFAKKHPKHTRPFTVLPTHDLQLWLSKLPKPPHILYLKKLKSGCLNQSASKSIFQSLKERICACVLEPHSKETRKATFAMFFPWSYPTTISFFSFKFEPRGRIPEESVKIAISHYFRRPIRTSHHFWCNAFPWASRVLRSPVLHDHIP